MLRRARYILNRIKTETVRGFPSTIARGRIHRSPPYPAFFLSASTSLREFPANEFLQPQGRIPLALRSIAPRDEISPASWFSRHASGFQQTKILQRDPRTREEPESRFLVALEPGKREQLRAHGLHREFPRISPRQYGNITALCKQTGTQCGESSVRES